MASILQAQAKVRPTNAGGAPNPAAVLEALNTPKPKKKAEPKANDLLTYVIDKAARRQRSEYAPERAKEAVVAFRRPTGADHTPESNPKTLPDQAVRPAEQNPSGDEAAAKCRSSKFDLIPDQEKAAAARRILEAGAMGKPLRKSDVSMLASKADAALDEMQAHEATTRSKTADADVSPAPPAPSADPTGELSDLNNSILAALAGKPAASSFTGEMSDVTAPAPTIAQSEAAAAVISGPEAQPVGDQNRLAAAGGPVAEAGPRSPALSSKARKIYERLEAEDDGTENWIFSGL